MQARAVAEAAERIGEDVSAWRRARRMTQADLALRAHVSVRTLSKIESGDMSTSTLGLLRVLHTLGVLEGINAAIDPNESEVGMALLRDALPKRVRHG